MTEASPAESETRIRFTSIEPISQHQERVDQIAKNHGFVAEFHSETLINAPFCGNQYHVQEVRLIQDSDSEAVQWVRCINELSEFEKQHLADSFFEVLG